MSVDPVLATPFVVYCYKFYLYTGVTNCDQPHGKTHDLVMHLLENYKNKGYYVYMDNFYGSPYQLFYNLLKNDGTGACGTERLHKGLPKEVTSAKFKNKGKLKVVTHSDDMIAMRILDRKHATLLATVYIWFGQASHGLKTLADKKSDLSP